MLQDSIEPSKFGRVLSANLFFSSLAEAGGMAFCGFLVNTYGGAAHLEFGNILCGFACFRYIGSSVAYYIAGRKSI